MTTIFVELNPFGSRLQVLAPLIRGASESDDCLVLMPTRVAGIDLEQFLTELPTNVQIRTFGPKNAMDKPGAITIGSTFRALAQVSKIATNSKDTAVVFSAIDDYTQWLWILLPVARALVPRGLFFLIRYRVDDLTAEHKSIKTRIRGLLVRVIRFCTNAFVGCFDERVTAKRHYVLPDPWSGPFGSFNRDDARLELGWSEADNVVTLVGKQDDRKGFDVAAEALLALKLPTVRVCIVGRVEESQDVNLKKLHSEYASRLTHFDYYVDDKTLALVMAASTVILLPYHAHFTATSGVLVRAAASRTQVVASDHGLVAWRVLKWNLGALFKYPNATDLGDKILAAFATDVAVVESERFAAVSTSDGLSARFAEVLGIVRDG